jgi:hypothetical protein
MFVKLAETVKEKLPLNSVSRFMKKVCKRISAIFLRAAWSTHVVLFELVSNIPFGFLESQHGGKCFVLLQSCNSCVTLEVSERQRRSHKTLMCFF